MEEEFIKPDSLWSIRFLKEHVNRYAFATRYVGGRFVLDIACGIGYGSLLLSHKAKKVVAADISEEALGYARKASPENKVNFVRCDCHNLPFNEELFDVVVTFETIEHLSSPRIFLRECYRCLKSGGMFICSTPNALATRRGRRSPFHKGEFAPKQLLDLMEESFASVHLYSQEEWWSFADKWLAVVASRAKHFILGIDWLYGLVRRMLPYFRPEYGLAKISEISSDALVDKGYEPLPIDGEAFGPTLLALGFKGSQVASHPIQLPTASEYQESLPKANVEGLNILSMDRRVPLHGEHIGIISR